MSNPNTPEGDNKPKYAPRLPPGLGTWRKKLYSDEELEALAEKNKQTDTGQVPEGTPKTTEQASRNREPRNINDIKPEEFGTYLSVPAWRIWTYSIFDAMGAGRAAYLAAANEAESKKLALISHQFNKGYAYLYNKLEEIERALDPNYLSPPFRGPGSLTTDMPWYVLEPLTVEEVKTIDRPEKLLRSEELQRILAEPDRYPKGSIKIEMYKPKDFNS